MTLAAAMITVLRTDMILSLVEVIASLRESGSRAGSNRAWSWAPNALKAFDPWSKVILAGVSSSLPDRAIADKTISIAYAPGEKGDAQILNWCEKTECFFRKNFKNLEGFRTKLFIDLTMNCNLFKIRRL